MASLVSKVIGNTNTRSTISNCHVTGEVIAKTSVGGLIHNADYVDISDSSFVGTISLVQEGATTTGGGLIYSGNSVTITDSFSNGEMILHGNSNRAGGIGWSLVDTQINRTYSAITFDSTNCESNIDVYIGGIAGSMSGESNIHNSMYIGRLKIPEVVSTIEFGGILKDWIKRQKMFISRIVTHHLR